MRIVSENGIYKFLDKDGKDFIDEMEAVELKIEATYSETKCIFTTIVRDIDIKVDEVEIKFNLTEHIKTLGIQELEQMKEEIEYKLDILDASQEN